ncbi:MAG: type II toxin-antitoxin system VapC family toxin [Geobacter sp.]|nr:type II toxin-antitoxin system VapC family toxin [Geobacter sp.]
MRALLDTNAFLWALDDNSRLSQKAQRFMRNGENGLFLSSASAWEIVIKSSLGKLELPHSPEKFIEEQMQLCGVESLPISIRHALAIAHLPDIHKDPFDRMLIAQAIAENIPIITPDKKIHLYDVQIIW